MFYYFYSSLRDLPTVRPSLLWAHSTARSIGVPDYFV